MAFATVDDVAIRLGRGLTSAEEAMAEMVLDSVTGLIAEVAGQDDVWAEALDPVPAYYKVLCVEKVITVGSNPNGYAALSEQLGAYQVSKTFQRSQDIGLFLSEYEERMVRRIANNAVSGSTRVPALLHDTSVVEDQ